MLIGLFGWLRDPLPSAGGLVFLGLYKSGELIAKELWSVTVPKREYSFKLVFSL